MQYLLSLVPSTVIATLIRAWPAMGNIVSNGCPSCPFCP